jgi:hypothetical protein
VTLPAWHEEPFAKKHDRKAFDCGQDDLNRFLQQYARQAHEHGASKTYVAVDDADEKTIYGYYTLSPAQVDFFRVPAQQITARAGPERSATCSRSRTLHEGSQEVGGTAMMIDANSSPALQPAHRGTSQGRKRGGVDREAAKLTLRLLAHRASCLFVTHPQATAPEPHALTPWRRVSYRSSLPADA